MVTRMLIPALLAALALSGCMPPPEERDATQAPSGTGAGSSSADKFSTVSCSGGSATYTINGTLSDGVSGAITTPMSQAKVFALGLPCRLATITGTSYSLNISSTDATAAGFGTNGPLTIIALWVEQSFNSVAAGRVDIQNLSAGTTNGQDITLSWGSAHHVAVNFPDGAALESASIVGVSDSTNLGIEMTQMGSSQGQPYDFDTNYLPTGTFTVRLQSTSGDVYLRPLFFDATGAASGDWDFTTINL